MIIQEAGHLNTDYLPNFIMKNVRDGVLHDFIFGVVLVLSHKKTFFVNA